MRNIVFLLLGLLSFQGLQAQKSKPSQKQDIQITASKLEPIPVLREIDTGQENISAVGLPLDYSPDNRWLAIGQGTTVKIYDQRSGKETKTCWGRTQVRSVEFAFKRFMFTGFNTKGNSVAFNVINGKHAKIYPTDWRSSNAVSVSRDGLIALFGSKNFSSANELSLWNYENKKKVNAKEFENLRGNQNYLDFPPENRDLLAISCSSGVAILNTKEMKVVCKLSEEQCGKIVFSPDGKMLAGLTDDKRALRVWDVANAKITAELVAEFEDDINFKTAIDFSCQGDLIAIGGRLGRDYCVRIIDVEKRKVVGFEKFKVRKPIQHMSFSADGRQLAFTLDRDPKVTILDTEKFLDK